jgi:cytochrome c-type biogenesis protein CcmH
MFVLPLALAAFALAVWSFRLERRLWTTLLAALTVGLAGYALQARPELPGAPRSAPRADATAQWASVDARKEMISARYRSGSDRMIVADAFARQGQFANSATLLRGVIEQNPADGEAWVALGNALVEHAGGALTPPALFAYRRAAEVAPQSAAPGYFLGLALIRQGRIADARQVWQASLEGAAGDGEPGALFAERAARLDALLAQAGPALPSPGPQPQAAPPSTPSSTR